MEPELKRNRISNPLKFPSDEDEEVDTFTVDHRKSIDVLSMQQQRTRFSSVLESLSIIENISEVKIAALALQLLSNQTDNRAIAKVYCI